MFKLLRYSILLTVVIFLMLVGGGLRGTTIAVTGPSILSTSNGKLSTPVTIPVAYCSLGILSYGLNVASSAFPDLICLGTSYTYGAMVFHDSGNEFTYLEFIVPAGIQSFDVDFIWQSSSTSQTVKWTVASVCVANGSDMLNPTFNATQTISQTSGGTANTLSDASQIAVTQTGCAAGNKEIWRLGRDVTDGSTVDNYLDAIRITPHGQPQS